MRLYEYMRIYYPISLPTKVENVYETIKRLSLDLLKRHLKPNEKGANVTGGIIFDAYMASTYLIACKLSSMNNCKYASEVRKWLEQVVTLGATHSFTVWSKNLDTYIKLALRGLDQNLLDTLDDPFSCLMFAHVNKQCLKIADVFPPPELVVFGWRKIMNMPPWAVPGILTAVLHVELSKKTSLIRLKPLIYLVTKYYKKVFNQFDVAFANFHQTVIQALVFENLYKLTRNDFYLHIAQRSWWLINSLVEPTGYVTRFRYPVWDTAWSVLALKHVPSEGDVVQNLINYLIGTQQKDGGWAFTHIRHPSDNDDTALALLALLETSTERNVEKGINFLLANQRKDGGWATYYKGNKSKPRGAVPSIRVNPWYTQLDVPVADITSHVVWALSNYYKRTQKYNVAKAIEKAIEWMYNDTVWEGGYGYLYGRWCQTFIPATASAVLALNEAINSGAITNNKSDAEYLLENYVKWIKRICNGGCGEDPESYHVGKPIISEPTIEHTAFAYLALRTIGESINIQNFIDIAAMKKLEQSINMTAFDVYINTVMPYYIDFINIK